MREDVGLTQIELAEAIGVSERTMRRYEQEEDVIQVGVFKKTINALEMSNNKVLRVPKSSPSQNDLSTKEHSNNLVKIPVFDEVYASAGHGLINEGHISQYIELDKGFLRSYFGLTSCGFIHYRR